MIQKSVIGLVFVLAAGIQLRAEQDFEQSYALAPMMEIIIDNKLGDIEVSGYDGKEVKVSAEKKGSDKDSVKIVENKFGPRIHIFPESPKFKEIETSVNFEVKVPTSMDSAALKVIVKSPGRNVKVPPPPKQPALVKLILKSQGGDIEIKDVNCVLEAHSESGDIGAKNSRGGLKARSRSGNIEIVDYNGGLEARSGSGNIKIKDFSGGLIAESFRGSVEVINADGHVNATSQHGDMKAEIKEAQSSTQWKFSSISGDIKVIAPKDLSAFVSMSSSGGLESDFSLDRSKRRYGENKASGKLGSGGRQLIVMSTVSGCASLMKE